MASGSGFGPEGAEEMRDLSDPVVVEQYKMASNVVNNALAQVRAACVPGASIAELCQLGDRFMAEETAKIYAAQKKKQKGIAFPTCVSVNSTLGHFSPSATDATTLNAGDLVKIDLGVHVDGFPVVAAQTIVCGASESGEGVSDRQADVLAAVHAAAEAVLRLCKPGVASVEVSKIMERVAAAYDVRLCEGIISHRMDHNELTCDESILHRASQPGERSRTEFEFQPNTAFQIDVIMSTGEGKTRESDLRPTVFRRSKSNYQLRMSAARGLLAEVNKSFPTFGFAMRQLADERQGRLGLKECLEHELLEPFPVLEDREGLVAQAKFTVLILPSGPLRVTDVLAPPREAPHKLEDPEVLALLAQGVGRKKKKSKARKGAAAGAAAGDAEGGDE